MNNIKKTNLNTLTQRQLADLMKDISTDVAGAIAPTYGPYGANTLIQTADSVYSTKDGWTVAQNLTYANNGVYNALKKLMLDCAQSVLLKMGDGTSTVILLAREIYKRIHADFDNLLGVTNAKHLEKTLERVVDDICMKIAESAQSITSENETEIIKRVALVSTNWDEEMSQFIADIYGKTHNPIIKFENSGTEKSYVEYISGYEIKGQLMLKEFYITDHSTGKCNLDNPAVLMFSYPVGSDLIEALSMLANTFEDRKLVIAAPDFTPDFVNSIKSINMANLRRGIPVIPMVLFQYYKKLNVDKDCADDLCYLLGTDMIAKENTEVSELFDDLKKAINNKIALGKIENPSKSDIDMVNEECINVMNAAHDYLSAIVGTCSHITLTDKYLLARDFTEARTDVIEQRKDELKCEIELKTKECAALSMITEGIRMKRIRLGKLQLNMGVIYVGGFGDANLKAKRDGLDDATKACEAVYQSGYTVGGGIAPVIAIDDVLNDSIGNEDSLYNRIGIILRQSYCSVLEIMYNNKFHDSIDGESRMTGAKTATIIGGALTVRQGYNLLTDQFDPDLIAPVSGEVEILKGSMHMVAVMIGSNQLVFHDIHSIADIVEMKEIEEVGDISVETAKSLARG